MNKLEETVLQLNKKHLKKSQKIKKLLTKLKHCEGIRKKEN
jgi:hypothetical protein